MATVTIFAAGTAIGEPRLPFRLLARSGFGITFEDQSEYIVLCKINGGEPCDCHIDPYAWGTNPRTMFVAHLYLLNRHHEAASQIEKHGGFDSLAQGQLIDVEYLIGLRPEPKVSEAVRR